MSSQPDCPDGSLEALTAAGIKFAIIDNKMIVPIPFLGEDGEVHRGYLADPLHILGTGQIGKPANHQLYFSGGTPHQLDGKDLLKVLGNGNGNNFPVFGDIVAKYYFSHKKQAAGRNREYESLAEKIIQYYKVIAGPAEHKFPGATAAMTDVDIQQGYDPPFKFPDAHSAAAGLDNFNLPLSELAVALIGVGGTGSYILDYLAKTPVAKIKVFDPDLFEVKNSFRSPGTSNLEDFDKAKVRVYADRYSSFREGMEFYEKKLDASNIDEIADCDFVFLALDNGVSRRELTDLLDARGALYIDVGLGLERADDGLFGMARTTFVSDETRETVGEQKALPFIDADQEEYMTNIQIAEWNALNAAIAVIRFKSHFGFYADDIRFFRHLVSSRRMTSFVSAIYK